MSDDDKSIRLSRTLHRLFGRERARTIERVDRRCREVYIDMEKRCARLRGLQAGVSQPNGKDHDEG